MGKLIINGKPVFYIMYLTVTTYKKKTNMLTIATTALPYRELQNFCIDHM